MPRFFPLKDILKAWNPDDVKVPDTHTQFSSLVVLDYQVRLTIATGLSWLQHASFLLRCYPVPVVVGGAAAVGAAADACGPRCCRYPRCCLVPLAAAHCDTSPLRVSQTDLDLALKYRNAEIPFVIRNVPSLVCRVAR